MHSLFTMLEAFHPWCLVPQMALSKNAPMARNLSQEAFPIDAQHVSHARQACLACPVLRNILDAHCNNTQQYPAEAQSWTTPVTSQQRA